MYLNNLVSMLTVGCSCVLDGFSRYFVSKPEILAGFSDVRRAIACDMLALYVQTRPTHTGFANTNSFAPILSGFRAAFEKYERVTNLFKPRNLRGLD